MYTKQPGFLSLLTCMSIPRGNSSKCKGTIWDGSFVGILPLGGVSGVSSYSFTVMGKKRVSSYHYHASESLWSWKRKWRKQKWRGNLPCDIAQRSDQSCIFLNEELRKILRTFFSKGSKPQQRKLYSSWCEPTRGMTGANGVSEHKIPLFNRERWNKLHPDFDLSTS